MSFKPVRRLKVAEQIAESIREAILGGSYDPGQSLPSERTLAEQFEVSRSSVREALLRLEAQGLVEVRHGGGTRVTDFLATAGLDPADVQDLDFAFFEALVTLCGNRVLSLLVNGIKRVYDTNRPLFAGLYMGEFDTSPHRRAVAALRAGDADTAQTAMLDYGAQGLGGVA